ncbi:MAG: flagellar basal body L-ring protein FlgH [Pseudohongiella sp.]|nr:flagellar basal body L-ring protein FlgH [Pseudohongiella sp.]
MNTTQLKRLAKLSPVLLLVACGVRLPEGPMPDDPRYAPVWVSAADDSGRISGSIYSPGTAVNLYQRRAHRLGDVLTINLNESTSASNSSGTTFNKESSTSTGDISLFGRSESGLELGGGSDFSGSANSDLSNQLRGNITVTVTDVLPNGLLEVRGEKWLQINRGKEYIRISGLVRRQDIAPDNTIASTRVADVRIAYSGTGTMANTNEPGILSRFFVGPYWPL